MTARLCGGNAASTVWINTFAPLPPKARPSRWRSSSGERATRQRLPYEHGAVRVSVEGRVRQAAGSVPPSHLSLARLSAAGTACHVGLQSPLVRSAEAPAGSSVGHLRSRPGGHDDAE